MLGPPALPSTEGSSESGTPGTPRRRTAVVQESVAELLKDLQLLQAKLVAAYNLERATAVTVPSRDPARSDTGQRSITSVSEGHPKKASKTSPGQR